MELREERFYTEEEYENFDNNGLVEFDNGHILLMSPPTRLHQKLVFHLARTIGNYLDGRPCEVYTAPFNVRLILENSDIKRVEPDISIICDKSKLNEKGCEGSPDLIIEVVTKGNMMHDYATKVSWYKQAGVAEYWIVDDNKRIILVYLFQKNDFFEYTFEDTIGLDIFNGKIAIDFSKLDMS